MGEKDVITYVEKMQKYIEEVKKKASKEDAIENFKKIELLDDEGETVSALCSK